MILRTSPVLHGLMEHFASAPTSLATAAGIRLLTALFKTDGASETDLFSGIAEIAVFEQKNSVFFVKPFLSSTTFKHDIVNPTHGSLDHLAHFLETLLPKYPLPLKPATAGKILQRYPEPFWSKFKKEMGDEQSYYDVESKRSLANSIYLKYVSENEPSALKRLEYFLFICDGKDKKPNNLIVNSALLHIAEAAKIKTAINKNSGLKDWREFYKNFVTNPPAHVDSEESYRALHRLALIVGENPKTAETLYAKYFFPDAIKWIEGGYKYENLEFGHD